MRIYSRVYLYLYLGCIREQMLAVGDCELYARVRNARCCLAGNKHSITIGHSCLFAHFSLAVAVEMLTNVDFNDTSSPLFALLKYVLTSCSKLLESEEDALNCTECTRASLLYLFLEP